MTSVSNPHKMKYLRYGIVMILLLSSLLVSYALPRAKYRGTDFLSHLPIPAASGEWDGKDVSDKLNINYDKFNYSFLNNAVAYNYTNKSENSLLLILLDAGDFHYPNVCLTSAGYQVRDLPKTQLNASGRLINAHTVYTKNSRDGRNYLVLYWIVIDKKFIPNWVEQKIKQLYFSLFNKKGVGIMVRLDIPIKKDGTDQGISLARKFVQDLSRNIPSDYADYLFGEIK